MVSALRFHPVTHCFSAFRVYALANRVRLNMYYVNITKHCVCVHACVCMGMFIPGPLCLTQCLRTPLLCGAKVRQSVETFLADQEAVIGVMRSG